MFITQHQTNLPEKVGFTNLYFKQNWDHREPAWYPVHSTHEERDKAYSIRHHLTSKKTLSLQSPQDTQIQTSSSTSKNSFVPQLNLIGRTYWYHICLLDLPVRCLLYLKVRIQILPGYLSNRLSCKKKLIRKNSWYLTKWKKEIYSKRNKRNWRYVWPKSIMT